MNNHKLCGALLRIERLRQGRAQKEVCFGICVPSYLSKIEHGTVSPDEEILQKLFQRMGIYFCCDEALLAELRAKMEVWFEKKCYALDTAELYENLRQQESALRCSQLAIDWLLIQGLEASAAQGDFQSILSALCELEGCMDRKQHAWYDILCRRGMKSGPWARELCQRAAEVLNNCFSYMELVDCLYQQDDYSAIHGLENRFTAIALEEGNTYYLAYYYFMKGSAYACLNMEALMMENYKKSIRFLQNTGWEKELVLFYYNIGATYIGLGKYSEAIGYLEKTEKSALAYHKLAIAHIRSGKVERGKEFLEKMKNELLKEGSEDICDAEHAALETDWLRYEEACAECRPGFMEDPAYLTLLERLITSLKASYPFGHLYFYKDIAVETYKKHRKYKKALEFEIEISGKAMKTHF